MRAAGVPVLRPLQLRPWMLGPRCLQKRALLAAAQLHCRARWISCAVSLSRCDDQHEHTGAAHTVNMRRSLAVGATAHRIAQS